MKNAETIRCRRFVKTAYPFLCFILSLSIFPYLPAGSTFAQANASTRFFPETGHTVTGRFLNFWQSNGGLMHQGYPISEEIQEISEIDGKAYQVQYFERAEFEHHPENQYPYDVLLSLLGRMRYAEKYPDGVPDQKPNESAGSNFFPETGKRLGGSFLAYWKEFGGLQQQGYPISDEIQERSDLDGRTYTVQYFERSEMEWHPGNTPPYDVLLSLLGKFRYDEKYGETIHGPGPPQLIAHAVQVNAVPGSVVAAGHYVYYFKDTAVTPSPQDHPNTIYGYDLEQHNEFLVTGTSSDKTNLATDGPHLTWMENAGAANGVNEGPETYEVIHEYSVDTGLTTEVLTTTISAGFDAGADAVDNGVLYYEDDAQAHTGLFARTLGTGDERLISGQGAMPVAEDGAVLWVERANDSSGPKLALHLMRLDGSVPDTVVVITEVDGSFSGYDVSGNSVVWGNGQPIYPLDIYLYNLADKTTTSIGKAGFIPLISGNKVVWRGGVVSYQHGLNVTTSIIMYDISTHITTTIFEINDLGPLPIDIVGGNTLLYANLSNPSMDPFIMDLYTRELE